MSVIAYHDNLVDFLKKAEAALEKSEAENNLLIGLLRGMADHPSTIPRDLMLLSCGESCFAVQTPPRALILSTGWTTPTLLLLRKSLHSRSTVLPGVTGPAALSSEFARCWMEQASLVMDQALYRLEKLIEDPRIPGEMIRALPSDWPLIRHWALDFHREALAREAISPDEFLRWIERRFRAGAYRLWRVGDEVCAWAGTSGETKNGVRIGPVYTPLEHRKKGYGTAITWSLSHELLKSGKRFCYLYTDLANPTSNSIYQKIGYREILRSQHWAF